ncbi:Heat shock transcription factor [Mycoemilia scoparia]|uniref:Heat shock transcription factor n=1 Tax=Mycoemilia scoparia TaxID=417184 RepID=A0A9W8DSA0_9FUNG|nr:Heat shock transcription factor [Mycoemilia scoparia]
MSVSRRTATINRNLTVPSFLNKLYSMVEDPASNDLIHWSADGQTFIGKLTRHEELAKEVLPRFFKHQNFSSFVRQLNMYGFHKVPHLQQGVLKADDPNAESWEFSNPNFQRGQPDLLHYVKRKKGTKSQEPESSSATTPQPDNISLLSPGRVDDAQSKNTNLQHVLDEIKLIRNHQLAISTELKRIQHENNTMWEETNSARQKYDQQQEMIDRIMQFLATVFSNDKRVNEVLPLKRLLLTDAATNSKTSNGYKGKSPDAFLRTNSLIKRSQDSVEPFNGSDDRFREVTGSNKDPLPHAFEPTSSKTTSSRDGARPGTLISRLGRNVSLGGHKGNIKTVEELQKDIETLNSSIDSITQYITDVIEPNIPKKRKSSLDPFTMSSHSSTPQPPQKKPTTANLITSPRLTYSPTNSLNTGKSTPAPNNADGYAQTVNNLSPEQVDILLKVWQAMQQNGSENSYDPEAISEANPSAPTTEQLEQQLLSLNQQGAISDPANYFLDWDNALSTAPVPTEQLLPTSNPVKTNIDPLTTIPLSQTPAATTNLVSSEPFLLNYSLPLDDDTLATSLPVSNPMSIVPNIPLVTSNPTATNIVSDIPNGRDIRGDLLKTSSLNVEQPPTVSKN